MMRQALFVVACLVVSGNVAARWNIKQVTSNSVQDFWPQFENDSLYWWQFDHQDGVRPPGGKLMKDGAPLPFSNGTTIFNHWRAGGQNVAHVSELTSPTGYRRLWRDDQIADQNHAEFDWTDGQRRIYYPQVDSKGDVWFIYGFTHQRQTPEQADQSFVQLIGPTGITPLWSAQSDNLYNSFQLLGFYQERPLMLAYETSASRWLLINDTSQTLGALLVPAAPSVSYSSGQVLYTGLYSSNLYRYDLAQGTHELLSDQGGFGDINNGNVVWLKFGQGACLHAIINGVKVETLCIQGYISGRIAIGGNKIAWSQSLAPYDMEATHREIFTATWEEPAAVANWELYQ